MPTLEEILNTALDLSMEFGANWLKPIQERLSQLYPHLTTIELNQYNKDCSSINKTANKYIRDHPVRNKEEIAFISFTDFEKYMLEKYKWLTIENLQRLYSQSCYYALK